MKHTSGPWRVVKDFRIFQIDDENFDTLIADVCEDDKDMNTLKANANLIAAAPELLEACEAVHQAFIDGDIKFTKKRMSDSDPYHPANIKLTQAISKAKGE